MGQVDSKMEKKELKAKKKSEKKLSSTAKKNKKLKKKIQNDFKNLPDSKVNVKDVSGPFSQESAMQPKGSNHLQQRNGPILEVLPEKWEIDEFEEHQEKLDISQFEDISKDWQTGQDNRKIEELVISDFGGVSEILEEDMHGFGTERFHQEPVLKKKENMYMQISDNDSGEVVAEHNPFIRTSNDTTEFDFNEDYPRLIKEKHLQILAKQNKNDVFIKTSQEPCQTKYSGNDGVNGKGVQYTQVTSVGFDNCDTNSINIKADVIEKDELSRQVIGTEADTNTKGGNEIQDSKITGIDIETLNNDDKSLTPASIDDEVFTDFKPNTYTEEQDMASNSLNKKFSLRKPTQIFRSADFRQLPDLYKVEMRDEILDQPIPEWYRKQQQNYMQARHKQFPKERFDFNETMQKHKIRNEIRDPLLEEGRRIQTRLNERQEHSPKIRVALQKVLDELDKSVESDDEDNSFDEAKVQNGTMGVKVNITKESPCHGNSFRKERSGTDGDETQSTNSTIDTNRVHRSHWTLDSQSLKSPTVVKPHQYTFMGFNPDGFDPKVPPHTGRPIQKKQRSKSLYIAERQKMIQNNGKQSITSRANSMNIPQKLTSLRKQSGMDIETKRIRNFSMHDTMDKRTQNPGFRVEIRKLNDIKEDNSMGRENKTILKNNRIQPQKKANYFLFFSLPFVFFSI